jgi:hypothetical protein
MQDRGRGDFYGKVFPEDGGGLSRLHDCGVHGGGNDLAEPGQATEATPMEGSALHDDQPRQYPRPTEKRRASSSKVLQGPTQVEVNQACSRRSQIRSDVH